MRHDAKQGVTRIESDDLGSVELPFAALYGLETARATTKPAISGITIGQFPDLIRALALIKKAAARTNSRLQRLSAKKSAIIEKVCDEILSGQHRDHFLIDVLQGGASYATNMNLNEVIANRGLELMGRHCGDYAHLHPSKDVNLSQTPDVVYAAAIRLALATAMLQLIARLEALGSALKEENHRARSGVDADRNSDNLQAFADALKDDIERLRESVGQLSQLSLAPTAAADEVSEGYESAAIAELSAECGLALVPASYNFGADAGVFVQVSGSLKRVATRLSTIAIDLCATDGNLPQDTVARKTPKSRRSAPRERSAPALIEMINQVAFQVVGADATISFAAEAGRLQRSAYDPVISYSVLRAITMLCNAAETFHLYCYDGDRSNQRGAGHGRTASNSNRAHGKS